MPPSPPSSLSCHLLTSRASTGGRVSAAGDIANGSLNLAAIIGIPIAVVIAVILILIVCMNRSKDKESSAEGRCDRDYV
ncbi:hypothetical protein QBC34DRAFT_383237 [Podospora aff. communis PSN243]|uniref:Uncharacterized protein n=1 Tax=Podospora aff. communis PSN243 TaxID=3040156 RepID=A0AAV9GE35_9PEZI|nr:hypothetical protein QBC34DRAFT_383237 [Podospora aff. communis PSN243]